MDINIHIDDKKKLRDELLEEKIISYPKLAYIKKYLFLFQKYYFKNDVRFLEQFINFLFQYKRDLDKIDTEFLGLLINTDLLNYTVPTEYIMDDLIVLIDKHRKDFSKTFIDASKTVANAVDEYFGVFFNQDFYKYYSEYSAISREVYESSWESYQMGKFIFAYAYYFEKDPSIIREFYTRFMNNYNDVLDHFKINKLIDKHGDIDVVKYGNYLIEYVFSLDDQKRKVIS